MKRVPLFVWPAAILVVELALQLSPYTGVFLMMFGAPAWSTVLMNSTLVGLAIDAWRLTVPRWLAVVPAALYTAYFGAFAFSYVEYVILDSRIEQANAAAKIAYNPATQDILVDYGPEPPKHVPSIAKGLISHFNLQTAYELDPRRVPMSSRRRLVRKSQCDALKARPGEISGFHVDSVFIRNACIASTDESPSKPTVTLRPERDVEVESVFMQAVVNPIEVTDSTGASVRVSAGKAKVLNLLPSPIVGCTLISSKPAWTCFAYFERTWRSVVGNSSPHRDGRAEVVASLLGLSSRKIVNARSRRGMGSGEIEPSELPAS
ncbi:MAG: hypothetical protein HOP13_04890 [Alphaproteobacteria bacterium]|nr:hypothetical protein [Alphaproteobacteria bacterium]